MSLRTRLLLFLLTLAGVAALAVGGVTYRTVLAETDALFDYQLRQMALSLRDQGQATPPATADGEPLDYVAQIWSSDGVVVYASHPGTVLPPRVVLGYSEVSAGGRGWRVYSLAARGRVVQVGQPVEVRRVLAASAAWRSVLPLLLTSPLVALGVWWLVGLSLAPLKPLVADVRRRAADSLQPLPDTGLPSEIAPLVSALNALLGRLQGSFDAQRAFVADAAHELRSPLTALKLQLDVLRGARTAEEREEAQAALAAGVQRAHRLVEQLLALARAEPGGAETAFERVDLAEVARQAIADALAPASVAGAELSLLAPQPVPAQADAAALRMLLRNLIDNAIRYAGPRAQVQIGVDSAAGAARITVDDRGPGIPPAERDRVFARFYRRDGQSQTGSGLGLAIVRAIADRHGAALALGEAPGGGLRVQLTLPAAP